MMFKNPLGYLSQLKSSDPVQLWHPQAEENPLDQYISLIENTTVDNSHQH